MPCRLKLPIVMRGRHGGMGGADRHGLQLGSLGALLCGIQMSREAREGGVHNPSDKSCVWYGLDRSEGVLAADALYLFMGPGRREKPVWHTSAPSVLCPDRVTKTF